MGVCYYNDSSNNKNTSKNNDSSENNDSPENNNFSNLKEKIKSQYK